MHKEDLIKKRAIDIGNYITNNNKTIREAAQKFGVGRSTVFRDIHNRLPEINKKLSESTLKVIQNNKNERHIRGGDATKRKHLNQRHMDIKTII